ncbi:MAG: sporulation integral membrane protein YtvI [Clostridiales bacterium]|nr:sporulation integral membrane protein YtvI [Clostridiales bacterium]
MNKIESRKKFLINLLFAAAIVALVYLYMNYAFWITFPFIMAILVAAALQRPLTFITSHTPLKKGFVAVVLQILVVIAILGPIALLISRLIFEFSGFFEYLKIKLEDIPSFIKEIQQFIDQKMPEYLKPTINSSVSSFFEKFQQGGAEHLTIGESISNAGTSFDFTTFSSPLKSLWNTAKQLPTYILSVLVAFIAGCFITIDYQHLKEAVVRQFSDEKIKNLVKAKKTIKFCLSRMGKAYLMIITITFFEMFISFNLFKLFKIYDGSYIFVLSLVIAIVDILPVLGTGTILIPWGLYSLITGDIKLGIAILVLYVAVTVLRQVIEPKLVSGQLGLPPFITIVAMFFGVKLFGFIGLFALPLAIIVIKILNDEGTIHLWVPSPQEESAIQATNEEIVKAEEKKKSDKENKKNKLNNKK